MSTAYIESSALTKLVIRERESQSLEGSLRSHERRVCSELGTVEVSRAAARSDGVEGLARARALLLRLDSIPIDVRIVEQAARIEPWTLRSLDAIHVATALSLVRDDVVFYTYDQRAIEAAQAAGLTIASPT
ncbi:MAG: type II toxin-antitoxin system VapC family toxin [Acidimicrobiia bacterium]|jgi:uncharacterized protein